MRKSKRKNSIGLEMNTYFLSLIKADKERKKNRASIVWLDDHRMINGRKGNMNSRYSIQEGDIIDLEYDFYIWYSQDTKFQITLNGGMVSDHRFNPLYWIDIVECFFSLDEKIFERILRSPQQVIEIGNGNSLTIYNSFRIGKH
jgi:hypothetical protein